MTAVNAHNTRRPAPRPTSACRGRATSGCLPGRQQVPPTVVFLTAQQLRAEEQPPHGAEDHERHGDLEDGEARHRLELRRRTEQGAGGLVRAVGGSERIALGLGLVDRRVADLGRRNGNAEDETPQGPGADGPRRGEPADHRARHAAPGGPVARRRGQPASWRAEPWSTTFPPYWARNSSSSEGSLIRSLVTPASASTFMSGATEPRTWQRRTCPSVVTELTPGHTRDVGHGTIEGRLDADRAEVSHVGQRARLDQLPLPQDAHAVAERLDLAHDVGREEDGLTPVTGFSDAGAKGLLHERIESARRLVEDEQVGTDHQRADEDDLLAVPPGIGTDLLVRIEVEAGDQLVAVGHVDLAVDPAEQVERLGTGQRRPQVGFPGHVGEAPMRLDGLALAVEAEDLAAPRRRLREAEHETDRRRLAGSIGAEVPDHLPRRDLEVEMVERHHVAEALGQAFRSYCHVTHRGPPFGRGSIHTYSKFVSCIGPAATGRSKRAERHDTALDLRLSPGVRQESLASELRMTLCWKARCRACGCELSCTARYETPDGRQVQRDTLPWSQGITHLHRPVQK